MFLKKGKKKTSLIRFLIDIIFFSIISFGGPLAHIALMDKIFVQKRKYISLNKLKELFSLAQALPGPSSTQTLIGISFLKGGYTFVFLTLLIWLLPSASIMYLLALNTHYQYLKFIDLAIFQFVIPVIIAVIGSFCLRMFVSFKKNNLLLFLLFGSFVTSLILNSAYVFPILIFLGGFATAFFNKPNNNVAFPLTLRWLKNISQKQWFYFFIILIIFALLGAVVNRTSPFSLPIRLLENFYRNGILVFGGGDVLIPVLYNEFVEVKEYLASDSFLSAYAIQKILPGPVFSFSSYVGATSMLNSNAEAGHALLGSIAAIVGINLPGFFLMIFILPFWEKLQESSKAKKTVDGISAVVVGFSLYSMTIMTQQLEVNFIYYSIIIISMLILHFTKISPIVLIILSLITGTIVG